MIEMLKKNPEIVTSVASALGYGSLPNASIEEDSKASVEAPQSPDTISASAPVIQPKSFSDHGCDDRTRLLLALRPYLSRERQEIIDHIIKFSKIGDLLKRLT